MRPPRYPHLVPNPLSLVPVALAAGGGRIDGVPAAALVAAGFTLLQRSAPLVRAMAGRRSALLLPPSAAVLTALAASDGRGAVVLPLDATAAELARVISDADIGAVFTLGALTDALPQDTSVVVVLDEVPRVARVRARGTEATIDLGTHFALDLAGEEDEGSDEEFVIVTDEAQSRGPVFTHRNMLALARGAVDATSLLKGDRVLWALEPSALGAFSLSCAGPLVAGAQVVCLTPFDAGAALQRIERDGITMLALSPSQYAAVADALEARTEPWKGTALRVCTVTEGIADVALQSRWTALTGLELRQAFGVPIAPLACYNAPHFPNRRGTLGIPFPGVQVDVRDGSAAQPVGAAGTLWVRGAQVSSARRGDTPTAAHDGETPDGAWRETGVRVRSREDGALELAD